jgi:hypothetical protein
MLLSELNISYWCFIGTIYLIILCYKDYKGSIKDNRQNWFMMGLSISLYSHIRPPIWYIIFMIFFLMLFYNLMIKFNIVRKDEVLTISWLFLGYSIIYFGVLFWYSVAFIILSILYILFKKYIFKYKKETAFYAVFLLSFIFTNWLFDLY